LKPKVLIILNRLVIGGQALDTIPLLYHIKEEFDLLILHGRKEKDEMEATALLQQFRGLPLVLNPYFKRKLNIFNDIRAFFFILTTILKFKPNIVHTHGLKSGLMGRVAASFAGTKRIYHTYHGHHFHSYFNPLISKSIIMAERLLAKITTSLVAISNTQKNELSASYKIAPPEKIRVIPLGIDEKVFLSNNEEARQQFRRQYAIADSTMAIGIIGRVVPVKNLLLFTQVVAKIIGQSDNNCAVKFFVVGDGQDKKMAQANLDKSNIRWCRADNMDASAQVVFTSWVTDVASALHGLDIVVLTSHNEGTPLSLIEAQFCGKPVVATNVGGVKDTFIDGESGFLVPAGNADIFAEKLNLLINDGYLRGRMGGCAAAFAANNFSKAKEIDSFKQLYHSCEK